MAPLSDRPILVVDDEPSIVDAVATALRYEGFEVAEATTGLKALGAAQERSFALLVLDVMLPDLDGFTVADRLRTDGIDTPILFLTARSDLDDKATAFSVGADDYVTKPFSLAELVMRVKAILRRTESHPESSGEQLAFADVRMNVDAHEVSRNGQPIALTATEFALLRYFLSNPRRVLSKEQILDNVWHYDFEGDSNVVETYVSYLRKKLNDCGPPLIHTVRLVGYVLRLDEEG